MISASEAKKIIFEKITPIGCEDVLLSLAPGRHLYRSLVAPINLPPFDHSAMDGYAIRSELTNRALPEAPVSFKVGGTIAAGDDILKELGVPTFRIMTGAPVPDGTDAVVPFEEAVTEGEGKNEVCCLSKPVLPGAHIRKSGEDVRRGDEVGQAGKKITSRVVALLAALGLERIPVFMVPRVAVISTGDELARPGEKLSGGKIFDSNGPAIGAALQEMGIFENIFARSSDVPAELLASLKENLNADALITIGGVSAGDFDLIPQMLKKWGAEIHFHKVAIKPGKPFLFATLERGGGKQPLPLFSLPGNPVSALVVFEQFVRPALLKMMGANHLERFKIEGVAAEELCGSRGKEDYLRVSVQIEEGIAKIRSAGNQGSARLLPLANANATLVIPAFKESVKTGERVTAELWEEIL